MKLQYEIISSPGSIDPLIRDFIAAYDHDFYPTISSRRDLSDFVQSVYQAKGKFVICFDGDKIVGLTSVYLDHPSFITYYHYIAIDKKYRGHGISTALYNYVHEICREYGVQWAIVKTWSTNEVSQAMFKKHGFFHLYTIEDDRSKGVHTYFYAKSFSPDPFKQPVSGIVVTCEENSYALSNFVKTLSSIPRINLGKNLSVPLFVYSNWAGDMAQCIVESNASHLIVFDDNLHGVNAHVELIRLGSITKRMVEERKKKWLLVTDLNMDVGEYSGIDNLTLPGQKEQERIQEAIDEIRSGKVSAAYYKNEIAAIAALNQYEGIVLGAPELHTMFSFDKVFSGIEIFDPWLELVILIQNNRMNFKLIKG